MTSHRLGVAVTWIAGVLMATPAVAQEIEGVSPPASVSPQGEELTLAGCGARDTLFVDIYVVALYLPEGEHSRSSARDAGNAKAVRLYPVYGGELPDEMPWNDRLRAELTSGQMEAVEQAFADMTTDDVATIAYAPGKGTIIEIDDTQTASTDGHGLMDGILSLWLGDGDEVDLLPDC